MSKYKVIKFGKEGCKPCMDVDEFLKTNNVEYQKVDITNEDDDTLELCSKYKIGMSIPKTFLVDTETDEIVEVKNGFNPTALTVIVNKFLEK